MKKRRQQRYKSENQIIEAIDRHKRLEMLHLSLADQSQNEVQRSNELKSANDNASKSERLGRTLSIFRTPLLPALDNGDRSIIMVRVT